MHENVSAKRLLMFVLLCVILIGALIIYDKQNSYWLGVNWERTVLKNDAENAQHSMPVAKITYSKISQLKPGDVLTHIQKDGVWLPLDSTFLLGLLGAAKSTQHLNSVIQLDGWLYNHRKQAHIFKLADNRVVTITPKAMQWKDLTGVFWGHRIFFYLCALIALGCIYICQKVNKTPFMQNKQMILVLSFIAMGLCVVVGPVSLDRLWGVEQNELSVRYKLSVCITAVYVWSLLWLLFSNPIHLGKQHPVYWLIWWLFSGYYALTVLLLMLNHDIAIRLTHIAYVILPIIILTLLVNQWALSIRRNAPLIDKIAIKSVIFLNLLLALFYSGHNALVHAQFLAQANPNLLNSIVSLMVSSSIMVLVFRQHLYRITYWWWVLYPLTAGAVIFLLAFFVSSNFGRHYNAINLILSIALAFFAIAITAFWHIYKLMRLNLNIIQRASLSAQDIGNLEEGSNAFWRTQKAIFAQAFQSTNIDIVNINDSPVLLKNNGEALQIQILSNKALFLSPPENGRRLFNEQDIEMAKLLRDLAIASQREKNAILQGEEQARLQVASDLHDDIGSRLHQLANVGTEETTKYAQQTLEQLRTLTHALHKKQQSIEEFFSEIQHELQRHGEAYDINIGIDIKIDTTMQDKQLNPMSIMQIRAILSELTRNGLQHENVDTMTLNIKVNPETTHIDLYNNGTITQVENWIAGVGTVSIKRRANQMHGEINWLANSEGGATAKLIFKTQKWLAL